MCYIVEYLGIVERYAKLSLSEKSKIPVSYEYDEHVLGNTLPRINI